MHNENAPPPYPSFHTATPLQPLDGDHLTSHEAATFELAPRKRPPILGPFIALIIVIIGGGYYTFWSRVSDTTKPSTAEPSPILEAGKMPIEQAELMNTSEPTVTGELKKLPDLGLLSGPYYDKWYADQRNNSYLSQSEKEKLYYKAPIYYSGGTIATGEFAGYERIYIFNPNSDIDGPGYALPDLLLTKNRKTYVITASSEWFKNTEDAKKVLRDQYPRYDMTKVTDVVSFTAPLQNIPLTATYSMHVGQVKVDTGNTRGFASLDGYTKLTSNNTSTTIYSREKELYQKSYYLKYKEFVVVDSAGVPYDANLIRNTTLKTYQKDLIAAQSESQRIDALMKPYYDQMNYYKYGSTEYASASAKLDAIRAQNPYPFFPSTLLSFHHPLTATTFSRYQQEQGCGFNGNFIAQNIDDNELESFATVDGIELFRLKDTSHSLLKTEYDIQTGASDTYTNPTQWKQQYAPYSSFTEKPTYEEYVRRTPLIFLKDPWSSYIVLLQADIGMAGGCGKPVIYLYPQKTQQVTVQLPPSVVIATSIPYLTGAWNVTAKPNGTLSDNDYEYHRKFNIDVTKRGSEYAREATKQNSYPYLFWDGGLKTPFPLKDEGYVVPTSQAATKVRSILASLGFTKSEQGDMLEYWQDELDTYQSPYIAVIPYTTKELNTYIPLVVTPKPDTMLRVFFKFVPLTNTEDITLKKPRLEITKRKGFTLVEWGAEHGPKSAVK